MRTMTGGVILLSVLYIAAQSATAQRPNARRRPFDERTPDTLKVGDAAPDFTLKMLHGDQKVTLSSLTDQRPVALVFGSYT